MAYYKSSDPGLLRCFERWAVNRLRYMKAVRMMCRKVGASSSYVCSSTFDASFLAFLFPAGGVPENFKRHAGGWIPYVRNKAARELIAKLPEAPTEACVELMKAINYEYDDYNYPEVFVDERPPEHTTAFWKIDDCRDYQPPEHAVELTASEYYEELRKADN